MTLRLVPSSEPVLRRTAKPVTTFDRGLRLRLDEMYEMLHVWRAVGLAAPQIGIGLRYAVVEYDGMRIDIVNPIVSDLIPGLSGAAVEGCLSLRGTEYVATRPEQVTVMFQDRWGERHRIIRDFMLARIIQHETDHLDGLLIDRFPVAAIEIDVPPPPTAEQLADPDYLDSLPVLRADDLRDRHTRKHPGSLNV